MAKKSPGICYLVGCGPGDPGLVTLRAKQCIEAADLIVYDYLCNPELLAWAKPDAERIYVGKQAGNHAMKQEDINALIVGKAAAGLKVARLKGGDPFVFGRGGEEAQELRAAGCAFEIVPGISSSIAGPAYAGIPVTHRAHNTQLTIFTGHEDPDKEESTVDYAQIAAAPGTKVMLMGVGRIRIIAGSLIDAGAAPDTPIALVRWATTPRQETLTGTLADIAGKVEAAGFKAPAVAVIGGVASLRDELAWFDRRPLFGRRIVVTRTRQQAGALSESLRALGADAFELPTIRIDPPEDLMAFGETVQHAHQYDWIVFTSPNGAAAFFEMFFKLYKDARELGNPRIAAIGPGTAAKVREYRFTVDLMPDGDYVAEGLIKAFQDEAGSVENLTFLWPKAEKTREVLGEALTKMGAIVDEVVAYRTVPETEDVGGGQRRFREEGADLITFASSSAVECFLALNLPLPEGLKIASIGPVTTKALEAAGLYADIEAEESTIPGLVSAIEAFYRP